MLAVASLPTFAGTAPLEDLLLPLDPDPRLALGLPLLDFGPDELKLPSRYEFEDQEVCGEVKLYTFCTWGDLPNYTL